MQKRPEWTVIFAIILMVLVFATGLFVEGIKIAAWWRIAFGR